MICPEASIVNADAHSGVAIDFRCRCWGCDRCFPLKCKNLFWRALDGHPNKFLTLTVNPADHAAPHLAAQALKRVWRNVRRAAERELGIKHIPFIAVFERHKSGWPHLHILLRSKSISQAWLSRTASRFGAGRIADIRKVKNKKQAAGYIGKYVSKCPERYGGTVRHWQSRDWTLPNDRQLSPLKLFGDRWVKHWLPRAHLNAGLATNGVTYEADRAATKWGESMTHPPPAKPRASGAQLWSAKPTAEPPPLWRTAA